MTAPRPLSPDEPFVLLDDAGGGAAPARLYRRPRAIVTAQAIEEVRPALDRLRRAADTGLHAAGYLAYEAGAALSPRVPPRAAAPLLWFGLFDRVEDIAPDLLARMLPEAAGAWIGPLVPRIGRDAYLARVAEIRRLIAAGDIYQANLTFTADLPFAGDPLALYRRLRDRQRARHCAIVSTGAEQLLSFSPELFFAVEGGRVTCRPMKGTAPRGADGDADVDAARTLAADPKQRAENLMIVDLMRNDLGRVAEPGSVAVPDLFTVETYPTLHQLVSSVTARARADIGPIDIVAALFPCGSVTGAPKIRAMQVIDALEDGPRGPYTGAIGAIAPDGTAAFNVAIRTLHHTGGGDAMRLGLGSGIVADSDPAAEWDECLAKARFIDASPPPFDLIETMRFEPGRGIAWRASHMERLARSAERFGIALDRERLDARIDARLRGVGAPARIRVVLAADGTVTVELGAVPARPDGPVAVMTAARTVSARDLRLHHKTSDRTLYRRPPAHAGAFETMFVDADGFLTEGSFTSIFLERDGRLLTPPRSRGLLPGTLRRALLEEGRAIEHDLRPEACGEGLFVGNALRGLLPARLHFRGGRVEGSSARRRRSG